VKQKTLILGAGITGLAAGLSSGLPVYEAAELPGGICSSYYVRPNNAGRLPNLPKDGEAYHFEIGGGHWIFGGDPAVHHFINAVTPVKSYRRSSAVYFAEQDMYVPYPIQNHLGYLGPEMAQRALTEIINAPKNKPATMAGWLAQSFGSTLTERFFGPFHQLYTAGLWPQIAPQDAYKSPVDVSLALQGAFGQASPVGYNVTFVYPQDGLNTLAQQMATRCDVRYGKQVVKIDTQQKVVHFADGFDERYGRLISTLPLNKMVDMAGLKLDEKPDPVYLCPGFKYWGNPGPKMPG